MVFRVGIVFQGVSLGSHPTSDTLSRRWSPSDGTLIVHIFTPCELHKLSEVHDADVLEFSGQALQLPHSTRYRYKTHQNHSHPKLPKTLD